MKKRWIVASVIFVAIIFGGSTCWRWLTYPLGSYVWCAPGESIMLKYKTGPAAPSGQYADPKKKEAGVIENMLGPGRHPGRVNPYRYDIQRVKNLYVPPGRMAVVSSLLGTPLPPGRFIGRDHEQGIRRVVLTPGEWRINPYGMGIVQNEHAAAEKAGHSLPEGKSRKEREEAEEAQRILEQTWKATLILPGNVGVKTLREALEQGQVKGIQDDVFGPGIYYNNPKQMRIDPVDIGYRLLELSVETNPDGTIKKNTGVSFPLSDGRVMHLDFTAVWEMLPKNAPRLIREFGTLERIEKTVIEPQVASLCKNFGSDLTTKMFIEGVTRERFQQQVTAELQKVGEEKGIHFLVALVRGFHPDQELQRTIQDQKLAVELKETLAEEQKRDTVAAELEAAKKQVEIAKNDFDAETDALVSGELEAGLKQAAEIKAETDRKVAELKKQTADLQAQITKILGKAEAEVVEATQKAEASRQKLLVDAYGGADAFKLAQFAQGLPDDLSLEYRVTGLGTWWTDAGSNLDKALAPAVLQKLQTDAAKDAAQAAPKQAVAAPAAPLQAAQKP